MSIVPADWRGAGDKNAVADSQGSAESNSGQRLREEDLAFVVHFHKATRRGSDVRGALGSGIMGQQLWDGLGLSARCRSARRSISRGRRPPCHFACRQCNFADKLVYLASRQGSPLSSVTSTLMSDQRIIRERMRLEA